MNGLSDPVSASPAVQRWLQRMTQHPVAALDALLTGRVALGPYDRARPAEALVQLLAPDRIADADQALQGWFAERLDRPLPEGLKPRRYAEALVEACRAMTLVPLPRTREWCAARAGTLRAWLRGFCLSRSRDPEAALLVALAHGQTDRGQLSLWQGVVKQGRPLEHVRHALLGLRLMPADDQGKVEHGLPRALVRGLLDYGEALARDGSDPKGRIWLEEVDFLAAAYPMSKEQWGRHFREPLKARDSSRTLRNWLDKRYPTALAEVTAKNIQGFLLPPSKEERDGLLQRLDQSFSMLRGQLAGLFDRHRHYARESGDSFYLVRTFCNAGDRLLRHDPTWSRDLAHEAARWEPSNPQSWHLLARALEAEDDWRRAEAVHWHARRRFPHNAHSHTQLGHALVLHGQVELGEAVFRAAIRLFPENPVCWSELAHTLKVTGHGEQAAGVYLEALEHFHRNPVLVGGLADTYLDLGRLVQAAERLVWLEQIAPGDDERAQAKLAQQRQRLGRLQAGLAEWPRALRPPRESAGGELSALADITGQSLADSPILGRIGLWRRQRNGGLARAESELAGLADSPAKLVETGLLRAAAEGWPAAAAWFDGCWERYAGDGVLRVHRGRARARAGEAVDWSLERELYPELAAVIRTEDQGEPPRFSFEQGDPDLSEEQRQDLWFAGLAGRNDAALRDLAEEDYLASRHLA